MISLNEELNNYHKPITAGSPNVTRNVQQLNQHTAKYYYTKHSLLIGWPILLNNNSQGKINLNS